MASRSSSNLGGDGGGGRPRREFPDGPIVAVGAVVFEEGRVLLIRRGQAPMTGEWSIPGGAVELGETLEAAVRREVEEETGLQVRVAAMVEVLDRIVFAEESGTTAEWNSNWEQTGRGLSGRVSVRYHYVLVDYICVPAGGSLGSASDALEARWVNVEDLAEYRLASPTVAVIRKAARLGREPSLPLINRSLRG